MGCTQSKIENEEAVTRCKDRKLFMKEAVSSRNAFAAAHSAYTMSLKNTGAALSDYAHGEVEFTTSASSSVPPSTAGAIIPPVAQPPYETLPPPPPPLPDFTPPPLQRAATMPEFIPKPDLKHTDPIIEEENEDDEAENESHSLRHNRRAGVSNKDLEDDEVENEPHSLRYRSNRSSGGSRTGIINAEVEDDEVENETLNLRHRRNRSSGGSKVRIPNREIEDDEVENVTPRRSRHRNTRSSGGSRAGISNREVEDERLSRPPPQQQQRPRDPPPQPSPPESRWDYFFEADVPMTNYAVEDTRIENLENERKMYDERSKKKIETESSDTGSGRRSGKAKVEAEMMETVAELPSEPPPPPPPPAAAKLVKKVKNVVPVEGKRTAKGQPSVNLFQVFSELDDCFLKASESANEVSKMLEANRLHYHSNFADNRGHIDHSARVMRVITWNRSFKGGVLNTNEGKEDFDSEENETHATVLDKMLAWEKKLYDEVKAGELMKLEYQRKVASLTKLKKRGTNTEALERTKAAVSHLHTRYIVDMQSMDSTVAEINRLRDEQLYPKLVALVDALATMWEAMRLHHESQTKIIRALKSVDISLSSKETTKHHHERTIQLRDVVRNWHAIFSKLMTHQKEYIKAINSWLKLNLIPLDNNLKEKVSSPQRPQNPPIQTLLRAWQECLEKLPEEIARTAIYNFTAVIDTIVQYQVEEINLMARCEETRNELKRKTRKFEDWERKYMQKRTPPDEMDPDRAQDTDLVADQRLAVEVLQKRLEEEEDAYHRQCIQVREKSLTTLRTRLPELFHAMSDFSLASSDMYRNLRSISKQRSKPSSSPNDGA